MLEVRDAYASVASKSGKETPEEIALDAARKAGGHPYMIQLVGYYMWRAAEQRGSRIIESCDVSTGESDALLAFYEAICAPLYYGLRSPQRFFIEAMAKDGDAPSKVSDIAERTGRTTSWAAKYRASLIREHVIESAGYGNRALLHAALRRLSTQRNPLARRVAEKTLAAPHNLLPGRTSAQTKTLPIVAKT